MLAAEAMAAWRTAWWAAAGGAAVVGAVFTPVAMGTGHAVPLLVSLSVLGAIMGWAVFGELPGVRHPVRLGIATFTTPFVMPGLLLLLGPATAWALVGTLFVTSPYVQVPIRRLVAERQHPSDIHRAGHASPEEALRRQWLESTRQLRRAPSDADRLLVVDLRAQILDDLVVHNGGHLPPYVWESLRESSGPGDAPQTS